MENSGISIKPTADGSNTLFDPVLNETYHSLHGALSESIHVYIHNGLDLIKQERLSLKILEIGFGTGLNLLLTKKFRPKGLKIEYLTLEPFLLNPDLMEEYYKGFSQKIEGMEKIRQYVSVKSNQWTDLEDDFKFFLSDNRIQDFAFDKEWNADLVYFDAFAPSRQPEMWTQEVFEKLSRRMTSGAILTTYCAQGQFKRHLKEIGFQVSNPKGANGKREMTVARKP